MRFPIAAAMLVTGCTEVHAPEDARDATVVALDASESPDALWVSEDTGAPVTDAGPGLPCPAGTELVAETPDGATRFDVASFGMRNAACPEWVVLFATRSGEWSCGDPIDYMPTTGPASIRFLLYLPIGALDEQRTWLRIPPYTEASFTTLVSLSRQEDPGASSAGALAGSVGAARFPVPGYSVHGCFDASYCPAIDIGCPR